MRSRTGHLPQLLLVLALMVAAFLLAPGGVASASAPASSTGGQGGGNPGPILASVTWNGLQTSNATSRADALGVTFAPPIVLRFTWTSTLSSSTGQAENVTVGGARLTILYFGLSLLSPTVVVTNPTPGPYGTLYLNWSPEGLEYLIAGAYKATAQLLGTSGGPIWNGSFFLNAAAPYVVGAALPALFLLLVVLEAVSIARSGRYDTGPAKPPTPPPTPVTAGPPAAPATPPPSSDPAAPARGDP